MAESRTIGRLLVANRGEIARRVFRSCRALGISTVAVFSDADADAPFVREADVGVALGGATPAESYLRAEAVVDAALAAGADAVHPGYGFLSENEAFARAVLDAGLIWVGPPPEAIGAMGSKIEARARMEAAGVPVLPGATVGAEDRDLSSLADEIGYPLLAKASAGGGGKGMRLVRSPEELDEAVAAAAREARSAFGDDTLFLERYVEAPRHVEIQIFADRTGRVISLFERDCSIQRRHQKVVEESPSPAVDDDLRSRMGAAAVAAGESIGYEGAGTVEFLLAPDGEFFFLEVNTRLQVEHPVTELVTGLDLVALQLAVAEGRELPAEATTAAIDGHAVEVRLYAEDASQGFLPVSGRLDRLTFPEGIRVDSGVESGSEVSPYYDPMLAKAIAWGRTREEAVRRLADALRRAEIHGMVTNREFLVGLLSHPELLAGRTDTHFLERHAPAELAAPSLDEGAEGLHAIAAALAAQAVRRAQAKALSSLPSGWRNNPSELPSMSYEGRRADWTVGYRFDRRGELGELQLDGEPLDARLYDCSPDAVDLQVGPLRMRYAVRRAEDGRTYVNSPAGQADLLAVRRFPVSAQEAAPGALIAPMPGAVLAVQAAVGARVAAGDPVVTIEAMKMEHQIVAPSAGTVAEMLVEAGSHVEAGALLAVIGEEA